MTNTSVTPSEVEAATQPTKLARPRFQSQCENPRYISAGSFDSAALRSG
jgi:hypothetical protein